MIVRQADLVQAFEDLISGAKSREDIANWANALRRAADAENLEFQPRSSEQNLWEAILYLTGVDLKESPTQYLHDVANFEDERDRLGLKRGRGAS